MANAVIEGRGLASEGENIEAENEEALTEEEPGDFEAQLAVSGEKEEFEVPELTKQNYKAQIIGGRNSFATR
jgi:hypothetical protein